MSSEQMTEPCDAGMTDSGEWLTAEQFAGMEGMPGTAKGARLRLEKLTALHPEIRRKRTSGKGFLYHISAAGMALKSERDAADTSADEQLNLWIQLFRTMKPALGINFCSRLWLRLQGTCLKETLTSNK